MNTLIPLQRAFIPRLAGRIHSLLAGPPEPCPRIWPVATIEHCERLLRLEIKAHDRGWRAAAARIRSQLQSALTDLQQRLAQLHSQIDQPHRAISSLRDFIADLHSLEHEFGQVEVDLATLTFAVTTSPIVLEDVYLGPFRIELSFGNPSGSPSYTLTPLDPHPAAADDAITHPHVQAGHLCEGDGRLPLRLALDDVRIVDVFQIVRQILTTYNPGSAYLSLDEWEGVSCVTCGLSTSDDERTSCEVTGEPLCWDCVVRCADCERTLAPDRSDYCSECDDPFCSACLAEGLCHACQKQAQSEENSETSERTDTEVHALCLEQTAVSAGPR